MLSKIISAGLLLVLSSVSILSATTVNAQSFRFTPWNPNSRPISVFTTNTYGEEYNYSYDYNTNRPLISSSTSCVGSDIGYVVPPVADSQGNYQIDVKADSSKLAYKKIWAKITYPNNNQSIYKQLSNKGYSTSAMGDYCGNYNSTFVLDFGKQLYSMPGQYNIQFCYATCQSIPTNTIIGSATPTLYSNNYNTPQPKKPTYNNNNSQPKQMDYRYKVLKYKCGNTNSIYLDSYYDRGSACLNSRNPNPVLTKMFSEYAIVRNLQDRSLGSKEMINRLTSDKILLKVNNNWVLDENVLTGIVNQGYTHGVDYNNTTNNPTCQQSFGYRYSDCTVQTYTY